MMFLTPSTGLRSSGPWCERTSASSATLAVDDAGDGEQRGLDRFLERAGQGAGGRRQHQRHRDGVALDLEVAHHVRAR